MGLECRWESNRHPPTVGIVGESAVRKGDNVVADASCSEGAFPRLWELTQNMMPLLPRVGLLSAPVTSVNTPDQHRAGTSPSRSIGRVDAGFARRSVASIIQYPSA